MKRGAEKQLTKDELDDENIEEVPQTQEQGFRKADESVLFRRQMKALPKRSMASSAQPSLFGATPSEKAELTTVPSGFKGFGAAASTATFSFTTPATASPPTIAAPGSQPAESPFKFGTGPFVSSTATTAAKQFSSILQPTPIPNGTINASAPKSTAKDENESVENYYKSLRGLNKSFRDAISSAIDSNPFVDLSDLAARYKSIRTATQEDFDSKTVRSQPTTNGTGAGVENKPKAIAVPSMPTPPASFSLGSSFPSPPISSSAAEHKAGFSMPLATTTAPSFTFGVPLTSLEKASEKPSISSSFSFGVPSMMTTKASLFEVPSAKPSPFGMPTPSPFGSSGTSSSPFLFGADKGKEAPSMTKSESITGLTNPFAPSASTSSTTTTLFGSQNAVASSSPFGKPTPKGNIGNPVGFSFGNNAPKSEAEKASTAVSGAEATTAETNTSTVATSSGGILFKPATSGVFAVEARGETPGPIDGDTIDGDTATPVPLGENPNDMEGEGEEDEETVHSTKVKIYRFGKKEDKPHWFEIGVGFLRVKKHKETSAKRLLSRNSASGRIMMNSNLYPGLKVLQTKQLLNLILHDEKGEAVTYRIRAKDEAAATELKEVIDKEILAQ